jgi:hypothetical protein
MQLIFRADLELLTLMVIDRANRRRYFRALAVENELDSMFDLNRDDDDDWQRRYEPGFLGAQHGAIYRHMLQDAILQCETPTKFTPEARPRRGSPKRRGRARESRSRFVDMDDQWTFQCETEKRHPLRDETSTNETTPKPDVRPRPHLGRNRVIAYGPVCFPHSGVSGASASVRLMIQRHSARRASSEFRQEFVSIIKSRET